MVVVPGPGTLGSFSEIMGHQQLASKAQRTRSGSLQDHPLALLNGWGGGLKIRLLGILLSQR